MIEQLKEPKTLQTLKHQLSNTNTQTNIIRVLVFPIHELQPVAHRQYSASLCLLRLKCNE